MMNTADDLTPLIAVVMGSKSDWETMRHARDILKQFADGHVKRLDSEHWGSGFFAEVGPSC